MHGRSLDNMKIVELIRLEESEQGTIGVLKIDKEVFCYTLEPADMLNKANVSCIPAQQYICKRVQSPKFGDTFEITNVPGRSHVLFHSGNISDDTLGCILLGLTVGKLKGQRAVLNSGKTFSTFMLTMLNESKFHLTIKTEY